MSYARDYVGHPTKMVAAAVKRGALVLSRFCDDCGWPKDPTKKRGHVAHHDNYEKPLDVRVLCRSCHGKHHCAEARKNRPAWWRRRYARALRRRAVVKQLEA